MPRGDGTGPFGQGPRTGRGGGGGGRGGGMGAGRSGGGQRPGAGPGGGCVCPNCGQSAPHQAGIPCTEMKCPNCGTAMLRG